MLKTKRLWLKRILKPIPLWSPVGVVAVLLMLWMIQVLVRFRRVVLPGSSGLVICR